MLRLRRCCVKRPMEPWSSRWNRASWIGNWTDETIEFGPAEKVFNDGVQLRLMSCARRRPRGCSGSRSEPGTRAVVGYSWMRWSAERGRLSQGRSVNWNRCNSRNHRLDIGSVAGEPPRIVTVRAAGFEELRRGLKKAGGAWFDRDGNAASGT